MRKVYLLPNSFTAASMFCGVFACFEVYDGTPLHACWLIMAAAVLDVLDGAIARLTRSTSAFGINFDSIADVVSFGLAPCLLAYTAFDESFSLLASAVCSLFAVFGALRLARFNVQVTREERKSFLGLPIPGAALGAVSLIWVFLANPWLSTYVKIDKILPPALVILAYLMVSKVPFYGLKSIPIAERQAFEILVSLVVIGCLGVMLKRHLDVLIFLCAWGYILVSLGYTLFGPKSATQPTAGRRSPASNPARDER